MYEIRHKTVCGVRGKTEQLKLLGMTLVWVFLTHWAEVGVTPRPFDLLSCSGRGVGAVSQRFGRHFTSQLIDLLDVLLLQGADGLKAAGQGGFELLSLAQRLAGLPGLVLDAQGFEEEVQLVPGAVGEEHLDVPWEYSHGALPISDELGEQFELLQGVALRDFAIVDAEEDLVKLVPAQDDLGLSDDLSPGGLARGVQLLHRHAALQLPSVLPSQHHSCQHTSIIWGVNP